MLCTVALMNLTEIELSRIAHSEATGADVKVFAQEHLDTARMLREPTKKRSTN